MTGTPADLLQSLLAASTNPEVVTSLCAPDVVYVSLNYDNPDLKKSMPWCGTYQGVNAIVQTFVKVAEYWEIKAFTPEAIFGDEKQAAAFGRFTYVSTVMRKTVTSPFAVFCKVTEGKISYLQFMEDTFATSASFRSSGVWKFKSDPQGGEVEA